MKNAGLKKIFISYRVQDTAGETGRLVDSLKYYFTDDQIFMDIENLEPGADFIETIEKSLDSCDVFLAVIGPQWAGERDGNIRINDPNDWVRMEVSTALKRNIRVVPVLVDNGVLPRAEQLPPELQPLLRRQAFEISNKRWRYDTEQLIQFLIHKAGIQPLKKMAQPAVSTPPEAKGRKTWAYVGAGFALAFVVLIIIGLLYSDESKVAGINNQTGIVNNQQDALQTHEVPPAKERNTQTYTTPDNVETIKSTANVSGRWQEVDEGLTSTFVLKQNGDQINVQVEIAGEVLSTGTGTIANRDVELSFHLFGMPTFLKAKLSEDNSTLKGTYTVQGAGATEPIHLVRKEK